MKYTWNIVVAVIINLTIFVADLSQVHAGATEEQMQAAGKLMRDVCLPKYPKVTEDIANDIKNGQLPNNKDANCYINCILEMMQAIKKGKYQMESTLKQVEILIPDGHKTDYRAGAQACKDATNGIKNSGNCDAAHALLTCFKNNIKIFFFP
ncbi:general odorant-binding protein 19a [Drosophila tropicalis]|uniref:general odorant-binding protein 19a n=1 Tax=Drosophila tropicalis TaxID=46794 RepID=UPI0035AB90B1